MKVGIGTITKDRAELLTQLLASYASMKQPKNVELLYIIVENSAQPTIAKVTDDFSQKIAPTRVIYDTEARPGIPIARNKVLDIALAEGCDYLTFVDDDETVLVNWLEEIYTEISENKLDLVGGPLEIEPLFEQKEMGYFQRLLFKSLVRRNIGKHKKAIEHKKNKNFDQLGVFTNNWIVRLDFCRDTGVRFDDSMGLAGGSDRRFLDEAIKAKAKTGWAENARVIDYIPPQRLRASYQIKRRRDQIVALNKTRAIVGNYKKPAYKYLYSALTRSIRSFLSLLFVPFNPDKYLDKSIEFAGTALGNLYTGMGWETKHYA